MKKLSKIFALILTVLCLSVGLVACGQKDNVFNYSICKSKFTASKEYSVTTMSVAINNTEEYLRLTKIEEAKRTDTEKAQLAKLTQLKKFNEGGILLVNTDGTEMDLYTNKEYYSYRTVGFIATKPDATNADDTVVVIQLKSTSPVITTCGTRIQNDAYYYTNKIEKLKAVYPEWATSSSNNSNQNNTNQNQNPSGKK